VFFSPAFCTILTKNGFHFLFTKFKC
jgi:hypothetical protein